MENNSGIGTKPEGAERRWDGEHKHYACADGSYIAVGGGLPENGVRYRAKAWFDRLGLSVSGTELSRDAR